jgi:hypothetical protein
LIESTAALGGRDNKKADFRHFLNSSKLSAKSVQVISPYTSNASDSHCFTYIVHCPKSSDSFEI